MKKKGSGNVKSKIDAPIRPLSYPGGKPRTKKNGEIRSVDIDATPYTSRIRN